MFLYFYSIGFVNSSVGRASDCSSEGRRFKPDLADKKTSLTQLVECQPHKLKTTRVPHKVRHVFLSFVHV